METPARNPAEAQGRLQPRSFRYLIRSIQLIHETLRSVDPERQGVEHEDFLDALQDAIQREVKRDPSFMFYLGANQTLSDFFSVEQTGSGLQTFIKNGRTHHALSRC